MSDTNITNYLNAVAGTYINKIDKSRYVFANFNPDIAVGDLVVVSDNGVLGLAKVDKIIGNIGNLRREIVSKVVTDEYYKRVDIRKQAAELKARMQERAKQLQDIALYEMLAENDPYMKKLITEYRSLDAI